MARRRHTRWFMSALLLAACERSTEPRFTHLELEPFSPLPDYTAWWEQTKGCSRLTGELDRISFYKVRAPLSAGGASFSCGDASRIIQCSGLWQAPHDIYLAPPVLRVKNLVKHEMLHDLIGASGHPPVFEECELFLPFAEPEGP